jgi:hypothetical protein
MKNWKLKDLGIIMQQMKKDRLNELKYIIQNAKLQAIKDKINEEVKKEKEDDKLKCSLYSKVCYKNAFKVAEILNLNKHNFKKFVLKNIENIEDFDDFLFVIGSYKANKGGI